MFITPKIPLRIDFPYSQLYLPCSIVSTLWHQWKRVPIVAILLPLSYWCIVEDEPIQLGDSMTPNFSLRYSKVSLGRGSIKMFATYSFVPVYSNLIFFSMTYSQRKWNLIGMCLVLECILGFLEILMALILSHRVGIGSSHVTCMSCRFCFIQRIWVQQVATTIYSASAVDKETEDCCLLDQDTR